MIDTVSHLLVSSQIWQLSRTRKIMSSLGQRLRQICWQYSVMNSGCLAVTDLPCVQHPQCHCISKRGTSVIMRFMLPTVLQVIKSFVSDLKVVYLLQAFIKMWQTNLSALKQGKILGPVWFLTPLCSKYLPCGLLLKLFCNLSFKNYFKYIQHL